MVTNSIEIRVNGEVKAVSSGLNVHQLLHAFDLQPAMIVVERNGDILRKDRYQDVQVLPGDSLELVHFVGGG